MAHCREKSIARIYNKSMPEPNTGCWLWLDHLNVKGYGKLYDGNTMRIAHRIGMPYWKPRLHKSHCPHGHLYDGINQEGYSYCKTCNREGVKRWMSQWSEEKRAVVKAYKSAWHAKNKERIAVLAKRRYELRKLERVSK